MDRAIIDLLQDGVAVCERPFADAGARLGIQEDELIGRLRSLLENGMLSRFGPMFDAGQLGGAYTLCAMRVPRECFDKVASVVNSFDEVAHNYEREHEFNMWFVIGSDTPGRVAETIREIETATGLDVIDLPKVEEFYVGFKLDA